MKLEDIQSDWKIDSVIDRYNLTTESLKIAELQIKYWAILMQEKKVLAEHQEKFKNFQFAKWYWYQGKMEKEDLDKWKWKQFNITILKGDLQMVMDGDEDIINYKLKIHEQADKVKFVEDILKSIHQRVFTIRAAIDNEKFMAGA
jgi:hypothetical protein